MSQSILLPRLDDATWHSLFLARSSFWDSTDCIKFAHSSQSRQSVVLDSMAIVRTSGIVITIFCRKLVTGNRASINASIDVISFMDVIPDPNKSDRSVSDE